MKDATEVQTFPVVATAVRAVYIALALLCYSAVVADLALDENRRRCNVGKRRSKADS